MKTIFIIGVDHSGTTILYKMLAQHPALCWFSQFSMRRGEIPGRRRLPGNVLANRLGRRLFHHAWQKPNTTGRYIPTPIGPPEIWDYLVPDTKRFWYEDDCTEEMKKRLQHICEQECKQWKKTVLIIKSPRLTRSIRLLATCLPDSCFIHILRDGKAVSLSNMHKLSQKLPADRREALKLSAMYWKDVVTYVDGAKEVLEGRLKSIHYEDFCKDVRHHIAKLLENVGLSANGICNRLPKTLTITNGKHFNECPLIYKEDLNTLLGATLSRYGYEPFAL